jgi:hypothetical protein
MATVTTDQETTTDQTTTIQDAFAADAAEKLADEAVADSLTSDEEEDSATEDSGLNEQGGLLPRLGEQAAFDGEGFEKPAKTQRQLAEEFLEHFQGDVEKAQTAVGNARAKLSAAIILRDDAEENLRRAIRDEKAAAGDEAADEAEVVQDDPSVDAERAADSGPRPTVFVRYPDADDDVETELGQYTTYGELIADYLTAAGLDADTSAFFVLDAEDGDICPSTAQIAPGAYGRRYAVLPAPAREDPAT